MARLAATDCLFSFTDDASSKPTVTEVGSLITDLYSLAYTVAYDHEKATTDETNDVDSVIDSYGFRAKLKVRIQELVEAWHIAGTMTDGGVRIMPTLDLGKDLIESIKLMMVKDEDKADMIDNIRFGGSSYTDWEGVF